jgi:hypothetical protein
MGTRNPKLGPTGRVRSLNPAIHYRDNKKGGGGLSEPARPRRPASSPPYAAMGGEPPPLDALSRYGVLGACTHKSRFVWQPVAAANERVHPAAASAALSFDFMTTPSETNHRSHHQHDFTELPRQLALRVYFLDSRRPCCDLRVNEYRPRIAVKATVPG